MQYSDSELGEIDDYDKIDFDHTYMEKTIPKKKKKKKEKFLVFIIHCHPFPPNKVSSVFDSTENTWNL